MPPDFYRSTLEDSVFKPGYKPLVIALNAVLADLFTEYVSLKQRHWHVKGIVFRDIHLFLDEITDEVLEMIDTVGEYVVSFGAIAVASIPDITARANITPSAPLERNPQNLLQNGLDAMYYLKNTFINISLMGDQFKELGVTNAVQDIITHIDKFIYKYQSFLDMPAG